MSIISTFVTLLATGAGAAWLSTSIVVTRQSTTRIIETFGKFAGVRTPGLSFKAPWPIQSASEPVTMQLLELSVDIPVKVDDNAFVTIPIHAQFRIDENSVAEAYYKLANPAKQIQSYLINQVVNSASNKTFDDLYKSKNSIENEAKAALTERMAEFGYIIENVLVGDPTPSDEVKQSFNRVLASKRLLEAAHNEGEATKVKAIAAANAEAESLKLRGVALVDFRKTIAGGNAEAIKEFTEGTGLNAADALAFMQGINEMEAISKIGEAGGKVVFMTAAAQKAGLDTNSALIGGLGSAGGTARTPAKKAVPQAKRMPIENIDSTLKG